MDTIKDLIMKKNRYQLKVDLLWLDWYRDRDNRDDIKEKIDDCNKIIDSLSDLIDSLINANIDNLEEI